MFAVASEEKLGHEKLGELGVKTYPTFRWYIAGEQRDELVAFVEAHNGLERGTAPCENQPLRYSRHDRSGSFSDEANAFGPSSTRVEEAPSK